MIFIIDFDYLFAHIIVIFSSNELNHCIFIINFVICVVKQKSLNYLSDFNRGKSPRWSLYLYSYRFRQTCPFDYFSILTKVPIFRTIEYLVFVLIIHSISLFSLLLLCPMPK